ncbi:NADPH-dependent 7-cyano-7-deazaguanine reductase QueF [Kistimonas asteriae]|uniref:NADPH-dependent 7-cyano-7-deazaguanine reductase QueF n=1 Tax=Kistimonas asteriae TaxID=517724 RepID=UPI001BABE719|nr:NADPH-dependent 7-cyano-7-deazaguanine reductase QueF [Kistimonas asteriae]
MNTSVETSPLGKHSDYVAEYDANLIFPIPRAPKWEANGLVAASLPFTGVDIWNAYELSWLNNRGKPIVAAGVFTIPSDSECIIESKSFKLYLNSFNQSRFESAADVQATMARDLSRAAGAPVRVEIVAVNGLEQKGLALLQGECIDELDIAIDTYQLDSSLVQPAENDERVAETLYSHLLKSNCPVTGQPDWGTLIIDYRGPRIDRESLLKYICSMRQHQDFHEQCVERVFLDIMAQCRPEVLTVSARYVRRGGLDINPWRTNCGKEADNGRLARQ